MNENSSKKNTENSSFSSSNGHDMTKRSQSSKESLITHLLLFFNNDQTYMVLSRSKCEPMLVNNKALEGKFFTTVLPKSKEKFIGELITSGSKEHCESYIGDNELTFSAAEEKKRKMSKCIKIFYFIYYKSV